MSNNISPETIEDDEDDELGNSDLREVYKQHQNNVRHFINLRFRHFTTFCVIMAFLSGAYVRIFSTTEQRVATLIFGFVMIFLFWILDNRTGKYIRYHSEFSIMFEDIFIYREKRIEINAPQKDTGGSISASEATNLIFFSILIGWIGMAYALINETDVIVI